MIHINICLISHNTVSVTIDKLKAAKNYGNVVIVISIPLFASSKSRMVYLSGAGLPRLSWKRGH